MIDFDKIATTFYCANHDRIPDAYASIMNILINTKNNLVVLCLNTLIENSQTTERISLLEATAKVTYNDFVLLKFEEKISKAHMQEQCFAGPCYSSPNKTYYLSVDDDFLIPYKTLDLLAQAATKSEAELYIYGLFDVINYRDFQDWDDTKLALNDLFGFIRVNGMRCLINHLYKDIPDELITFKIPGQSCGSYMVKASSYIGNVELRANMIVYPKFKRGYDVMLCNSFDKIEWIFGSNNYHTDRTKAHVDGTIWKQDAFRDDLMLDNSITGRPPKDVIGASSDKRKLLDVEQIPDFKSKE